jgi:RNA polymerase sigma-70 factor (ECF subfamily)
MDQSSAPSEFDVRLGQAWRDHHRHLLSLAFRVLGNVSEAEDAVQEAFARLLDRDLDEIDDVGGWLAVVVSRLCFDRLRSADWQRRSSTAVQDERHPAADMDPADRITLDHEVRLALHVVMAQLTPAERTAFVLHDVFSYSFDAISQIVGRTPAACRQLASRARRTLDAEGGAARFTVEATEQHRVAEQFIAACSTGDFEAMLVLLDPDVTSDVDVGVELGEVVDLPRIGTARQGPPIVGREAVARLVLRYNGPGSSTTLLSLPTSGKPTVIALWKGQVVGYVTVTIRGGRITHFHVIFDPAKLADLNVALTT